MKQFEKQYNESCNIIVDCDSLSCKECKKIQATVWRAALEWTIEEIIRCLSPQDAIEILREELKDD